MICENCYKEHDGFYGSGRFCSNRCARGFSTKKNRTEISKKVSLTLGGKGEILEEKIERLKLEKHASYIRKTEATSILDLSKRTVEKILRRMKFGCSRCGWSEDVCDIHHIVERKNGGSNNHENLSYVCPNCHRMIHSGKIKKEELINFADFIGDEWKKYYYIKNNSLLKKD